MLFTTFFNKRCLKTRDNVVTLQKEAGLWVFRVM